MAWNNLFEIASNQEAVIKFSKLLKDSKFLQNLKYHINEFANKKFESIKISLSYRIDETIPLMELLTANNSKQFLVEFRKMLAASKINDKNFLDELFIIFSKYRYFANLQGPSNTKEENFSSSKSEKKDRENLDDLENALTLLQSILKTEYVPLLRLIPGLEKISENVFETKYYSSTVFVEKRAVETGLNTVSLTLHNDEGNKIKFKKTSFIGRVIRYIKANPVKSVAATLLGMGIGVPLALTLPITGPVFLVTVVASIVVGGVIGFATMALLHNCFSRETRQQTNAQTQVPVEDRIENINKPKLSPKDEIAGKKLLSLFTLLSPTIAQSVKETHLNLAGLIRSNLKLRQKDEVDSYSLAKEYCRPEVNLLSPIDFAFIEKEYLQDSFFNEADPALREYYETLKLNYRKVRMQALEQLNQTWQVNFNQMDNLSSEKYRELEETFKKQPTIAIARTYVLNSVTRPEETNKLIALYHSLFPEKMTSYIHDCYKIKNVMTYFINKLNYTSVEVGDISDQELIANFKNKFWSTNSDKIIKIYSEFLLMASSEFYDLEFISIFIKSNAELDKSKLKEKISDGRITRMQQPVLNCIKLFLNAASLKDNLEYTDQATMLSVFYNKLQELSVTQVVEIFSNLRLNTYVPLNLNLFKELIQKNYEKTKSKLQQFNDQSGKINEPEFCKKNNTPKLQIIRNFLIAQNPNDSQNISTMQSIALLKSFYLVLQDISVDRLLKLFEDNKIVTDCSQGECILLLLNNYFEFKRPDDLGYFKEIFFSQKSNLFYISSAQVATHFFRVPKLVKAEGGSALQTSLQPIEVKM